MRIYIESTIPSYVLARPARDLLQAARRQLTRDWWDLKREHHELFTSQVVLDEIADGEAVIARQQLKLLRGVPLLKPTVAANELGREILRSGLLPATADGDAAHIALATVHETDGLDWKTAVRCNFIYALNKAQFRERRGHVSELRQVELVRKMRFCFRWPLA